MELLNCTIELAVPAGFRLAQRCCSYGFFLMQPNTWIAPSNDRPGEFTRPLTLHDGEATPTVTLRQEPGVASLSIQIQHEQALSLSQQAELLQQVRRMLRLDDEQPHEAQVNPEAAARQRSLLFRSPTLWEDLVKTILLCNCGWTRTLSMAQALCQRLGSGAFPGPARVAACTVLELQQLCGLGYRAAHVHKLAVQACSGELRLEQLSLAACDGPEQLYQLLLALPGIGPFSACNLMQLLGFYEWIPCDTETVRHLRAHHTRRNCTLQNVQAMAQQVYAQYAPYQFLAYWHELWTSYEACFGCFETLSAEQYSLFTGANMRKALAAKVKAAAAPALPPLASIDQ